MRLLALLALLPAAPAQAAPGASKPDDPDLKLDTACPEGPAADALAAALPTYVKELVVLWPRAGRVEGSDPCVPAARLTLVDHPGRILTLTVLRFPEGTTPPARDFRALPDDPIPRAELELAPDSAQPHLIVRIAGALGTPREGLEAAVDFLELPSLVAAVGAVR